MSLACSFAPLSKPDARILILGSMPGVASLEAQQYYAHPRNLFWPIMEQVLGAPRSLSYTERGQLLVAHKIAVWDVLETCSREGSLDSDIKDERPNDFTGFFANHPNLRHIFFNGQKAQNSYNRWVLPTIKERNFTYQTLPSTSPANASFSFERKIAAWKEISLI